MKAQKSSKKTITEHTFKSFEEIVPQLSGESQRNYETLRLYCQEDSLIKLSNKLVSLLEEGKCLREVLSKKGKFPSKRTLDRWCKKFDWVQRKDKWVAEECRSAFFLMTVKLHQNTTKTPPEMTVKQGQMSANEGSFQGSANVDGLKGDSRNDGDSWSNEVKSGQKTGVTCVQMLPNATKILPKKENKDHESA